ncbi:ribonuclease E inhibitor RraB [Neogemmobacter tilapiae]|uniref:Regulator of ribonuclease activity B domain-containing protein n=1 Tax=Neogemmobacter tilapiae TaxID=875041 RepID=A0A918TQA5_9RHOB|nr:ribonuclease E inhibitor RraB [Gemmobacter tilapiae]GHC57452.1 hypothetical protein GCM10007315_21100 [Gemmobacter tilapiae]
MAHDYEEQRAETLESLAEMRQEADFPAKAMVDFQFYPDGFDANWTGLATALQAAGFTTVHHEDDEYFEATIGPIETTDENIWHWEKLGTEIALRFDFLPDGWGLFTEE